MNSTPSRNDAVNAYIKEFDPALQELFVLVREAILQAYPNLREDIKWRNCLVYSTTKNLIQTVVGKGKISLIFFDGARLGDDHHLLEGDGHKTRTMRITSHDFNRQALQNYVQQAVAVAQ